MRDILEVNKQKKWAYLSYGTDVTILGILNLCVEEDYKEVRKYGDITVVRFYFKNDEEFVAFLSKATSIDDLNIKYACGVIGCWVS